MNAGDVALAPARRAADARGSATGAAWAAWTLLGASLLLAGCASLGEPAAPAPMPQVAASWQTPLPHGGEASDLVRWWSSFNDPLLPTLIDAAQAASPTLVSAAARIEAARASRVAAGAALGPRVDATAAASRGVGDPRLPVASSASAGLLASWEIDLFGGNQAARDAAQARLEGAQALWHDARVSLAAETASGYLALRACEAQLVQAQIDTASRTETLRLTELSARAGFSAPADAALARASAAQGRSQETAQRGQCDALVKLLVEITGLAEPDLRARLAGRPALLPQPAPIALDGLPVRLLAQRPDLFNAARAVAAAAGDQAQSEARQLPQVSLSGSFGGLSVRTGELSSSGATWSFGPLLVNFPLFDGGARAADTVAARAAYDEAVAVYQAQARRAVREVEQALVVLQSTAARSDDAHIAVEGFDAALRATEALYQGGLGNLIDLELARRASVGAHSTRIELERERVQAWISLYRALGGGWQDSTTVASAGAGRP